MKNKLFVVGLLACMAILLSYKPVPKGEPVKKPLRRSDSFFGLHFDFHASLSDSMIGKTFTYGMIDSLLTLVKPDYIQVDCKGHPGISSYPTKVGNPAPGFVKDPLKIWREVTRKHGVALFVHYSGVIDAECALKHPDWAAVEASGKRSGNCMSVKGPYVDSLLIPQFKELIDRYRIDGCWIDGECWALDPDYSQAMLDAFHAETGIQTTPESPADSGWYEFLEFNRKAFRQYMAHYTDVLHRYDPSFQITSNWAFSSLMPEPVDVNIDFISGDFSPRNSVYSGLYESRCIAPQGKPWDLMAWSFAYDNTSGAVTKSAAQLEQLAATVISMGGGYQIYSQQNRDASPRPWLFGMMKEVAGFCRDRQPYCKGAVPIPQIALLYSTANYKKYSGRLYHNSSIHDPIKGMLNILLDGQNAVEIRMEHNLRGKMGEYPLIVIPECRYLTHDFKAELLGYVKNGGNLLVVGPSATAMFTGQLNVELQDTASVITRNIACGNQLAGIHTLFQPVIPGKGVETCGRIYQEADFRFLSRPAATITSYGKGKIAGVYFNIGANYLKWSNTVYRDFINAIVRELFPDPLVTVSGSDHVVTTVNKLGDRLAVNLINISGEHADEQVARYNEIPVIGPLHVKVRLTKRPARVTLQPENTPLEYTFAEGIMETTVDRLYIHSIMVIE